MSSHPTENRGSRNDSRSSDFDLRLLQRDNLLQLGNGDSPPTETKTVTNTVVDSKTEEARLTGSHLEKTSNVNSDVQCGSSHTSKSQGTASSVESSVPSRGLSTLRHGEERIRPEQVRNQVSQPFYHNTNVSNVSAAASLLAQLTSPQQPYQNVANVAAALALVSNIQPSCLQQSPQNNLFLQAAAALSRSQQPLLGHGLNSMTGSEGQNQPISSTAPMAASHQHLLEVQRQKETTSMHEDLPKEMTDYNDQKRKAIPQGYNDTHSGLSIQRDNKETVPQAQKATAKPQRATEPESGADLAKRSGNESSKNDPESVIVSCRARGMPMDHNSKNAYFNVTKDVRHGEDLNCSSVTCRNDGIKFRYCRYCKAPVAKRNFNTRHKHDNEELPNEVAGPTNSTYSDEDKTHSTNTFADKNKGTSVENQIAGFFSPGEPNSNSAKNLVRPKVSTNGAAKRYSEKNKIGPAEEPRRFKRTRETTISQGKFETIMREELQNKQECLQQKWIQQWYSLFHERPSSLDHDTLSSWLLKVLSVSDRSQFIHANTVSNMMSAIDNHEPSMAFPGQISSSDESDTSTYANPSNFRKK